MGIVILCSESYPFPETSRKGCSLYNLHVQVALSCRRKGIPSDYLEGPKSMLWELWSSSHGTWNWGVTFLFFDRGILTVRQGTRWPVAQSGQAVFISAEALCFRSRMGGMASILRSVTKRATKGIFVQVANLDSPYFEGTKLPVSQCVPYNLWDKV